MVRKERVRQGVVLAQAAQPVGIDFDRLARTGKHEALGATQLGEQMPGNRGFGRQGVVAGRVFAALQIAAQLHLQFLSVAGALQNGHGPGGLGPQIAAGKVHVPQRRRQPDPPQLSPARPFHPRQQRAQMHAALAVQQGVQFVDHHGTGGREQGGDFQPAQHEQCLKRFRRDQQDAARGAARPRLDPGGNVAVPGMHRNSGSGTEVFQPFELIVDQRLERPDIDQIKAPCPRRAHHLRDQRQKRRLGLAACRRRRDDQIGVAVQHCGYRAFLNGAQRRPALVPDPAADRVCQPLKPCTVRAGSWQGHPPPRRLVRRHRQCRASRRRHRPPRRPRRPAPASRSRGSVPALPAC